MAFCLRPSGWQANKQPSATKRFFVVEIL